MVSSLPQNSQIWADIWPKHIQYLLYVIAPSKQSVLQIQHSSMDDVWLTWVKHNCNMPSYTWLINMKFSPHVWTKTPSEERWFDLGVQFTCPYPCIIQSHIHWGCGKLRYCLLYVVICCIVWCWWHFWVSHFNKVLVEVWPHGLHIWTVLSSDMGDLNAKLCTFLCTLWLWWCGSCSCFSIKQEVAITQTHIGSLGSEVTGLRQSEHHLPVTRSTPCVTFVVWYTWKFSALIVFFLHVPALMSQEFVSCHPAVTPNVPALPVAVEVQGPFTALI